MQYQKILVQRNNYLKQITQEKTPNNAMLEVWNEQLAQFGVKIIKKRQSFIKKLQIWAENIHQGITNDSEAIGYSILTFV